MLREVVLAESSPGGLQEVRRALGVHLDVDPEVTVGMAAAEVIRALSDHAPEALVIVDEGFRDGETSAFGLVRLLRELHADLPIVLSAERGSVELAAKASAAGVTDLLVRGELLPERVTTLVRKLRILFDVAAKARRLDRENAALQATVRARSAMIGRSPAMQAILDQVRRIARIPRPVLILGERGTGKELIARAIHEQGGDPARPLVCINCAAFSDALLETELFGHERGAFTGADRTKPGKFEEADGGTLFLDEIGHMSAAFQQKILRVVEYGTFMRVGGRRELSTRTRLLAATNVDLAASMAAGRFLSDLYDRLAFDVIRVPALRERPGDIRILAEHYLAEFAREIPAFSGKRLTEDALVALERYSFPGNVRELKNIIERAAYRDDGDHAISAAELGLPASPPAASEESSLSFDARVQAYRAKLLNDALLASGGNQAAAARALGLTYHKFRHLLRNVRTVPGTPPT